MRRFDRQAMQQAAAELQSHQGQGMHHSLCALLEEAHQEAVEIMLAAGTERDLWQAQGAANAIQELFTIIARKR